MLPVLIGALLLGVTGAVAAEEGASVVLQQVAADFEDPLQLTHANDGSGRLFVVEQSGRIYVLEGGKRRLFLDIHDQVSAGGEKGLLSLAFHPGFRENGRLFVNYTTGGLFGLKTVVSQWRVKPGEKSVDAASERILLQVRQPYPNHNGGQIAFGPDGMLYIGMGDGGWANDPHGHGQNLGTLLGAMLRIDVDHAQGGRPYAIPAGNPFAGVKGARPEIWAYGLRNPWRFSFDRQTGALYAGDVGQDDREEIDRIEGGGNYGWNIMEGGICTPAVNRRCDKKGLALPLIDYNRDAGISVIGGFVYRGSSVPSLYGRYIFGDWGSGRIWSLDLEHRTMTLLLDTDFNISSFGEDEAGELYVVDLRGAIYKIVQVR